MTHEISNQYEKVLSNNTTWDTSSKQEGKPINHVEDVINNTKVCDLTVRQLKDIIQSEVWYVLNNELSRMNFLQPYKQMAPYSPPEYPWQQQVWCKSNGDTSV